MQNKLEQAFEFHKSGNLERAEILYKELLDADYDCAEVARLLALLYNSKSDWVNSVKILETAVKKVPKSFDIWFLLGLAYRNMSEYKKSEKAYCKALELNPESEETYYNLGNLNIIFNQPQKAIDYYKKFLSYKPDDVNAKYFLSLAYFRLKDYEEGVKYFENRLCRASALETQYVTYPNIMKNAKLWQGEDISDKILYTYYEAGYGDMIMFARYITVLAKKCRKLIIKPQVPLSELFRYNFPNVEVMDVFESEEKIHFDYHIPFLSIPYVLKLNNDDIFMHHDKYLKAKPELIKYYKQKFFDNNYFKIAVKWQGNTFYETDRVIDVEAFAPLFEIPNVKIYSAQTFEGSENLEKLTSKYDITDLSESFKDFSYTAAALDNVDLVVCSDTSLAHLAGAMRKPCIILLPYNYNWRWHTDLTHCDWYDSVKLYRQGLGETWSDLMKIVAADICRMHL